MKARPILMSAPMVQALLDGRKTQTRRVVKMDDDIRQTLQDSLAQNVRCENGGIVCDWLGGKFGTLIRCPYGRPGELLWVRESFSPVYAYNPDFTQAREAWYWADGNPTSGDWAKPKPSIHMPRWASRLTLELTEVRVERLQDIREADAVAEGVAPLFDSVTANSRPEFDLQPMPYKNYLWHGHVGRTISATQADTWPYQFSDYAEACGSYSSLWESINGPSSWDANPWVWVLSFRVHRQNVDVVLAAKTAA